MLWKQGAFSAFPTELGENSLNTPALHRVPGFSYWNNNAGTVNRVYDFLWESHVMLLQLSQVINVYINLIVLCGFSSCFMPWNGLHFTGRPLEILTFQIWFSAKSGEKTFESYIFSSTTFKKIDLEWNKIACSDKTKSEQNTFLFSIHYSKHKIKSVLLWKDTQDRKSSHFTPTRSKHNTSN